jgi:hypothetical protein
VREEVFALLAIVFLALTSGGVGPLFGARCLYIGFPLAALYAVIAVGETYYRIRKYRFKRRVRRFHEARAKS